MLMSVLRRTGIESSSTTE